VERGERVVVGVNRYQLEDETPLEILKIDAALEGKQIERVTSLKGRRDSAKVERRLAALKEAAVAASDARAQRVILTHRPIERESPPDVELAYDGLELEF
ncbi:MAG: methylmalonyl-CoA mutase family protein, partial [Gaiellaceae bacterium]